MSPRTPASAVASFSNVAGVAAVLAAFIIGCGGPQPMQPPPAEPALVAAERLVFRAANVARDHARPSADEVEARYREALAAMEEGAYVVAASNLELVDRAWPRADVHLPALARARWLGSRDPTAGLEACDRCLVAVPSSEPCRELRPLLLLDLGRTAEAEEELRELIADFPSRDDLRERAARLALARGDGAGAASLIRPAVARGQSNVPLRLLLALALESSGDAAAEAEYRAVAAGHTDIVIGSNYLAQYLRRQGRESEAVRVERRIAQEVRRRSSPRRMRPL